MIVGKPDVRRLSAGCPPDVRRQILADIHVRGRALESGPTRMSADLSSYCGHLARYGSSMESDKTMSADVRGDFSRNSKEICWTCMTLHGSSKVESEWLLIVIWKLVSAAVWATLSASSVKKVGTASAYCHDNARRKLVCLGLQHHVHRFFFVLHRDSAIFHPNFKILKFFFVQNR